MAQMGIREAKSTQRDLISSSQIILKAHYESVMKRGSAKLKLGAANKTHGKDGVIQVRVTFIKILMEIIQEVFQPNYNFDYKQIYLFNMFITKEFSDSKIFKELNEFAQIYPEVTGIEVMLTFTRAILAEFFDCGNCAEQESVLYREVIKHGFNQSVEISITTSKLSDDAHWNVLTDRFKENEINEPKQWSRKTFKLSLWNNNLIRQGEIQNGRPLIFTRRMIAKDGGLPGDEKDITVDTICRLDRSTFSAPTFKRQLSNYLNVLEIFIIKNQHRLIQLYRLCHVYCDIFAVEPLNTTNLVKLIQKERTYFQSWRFALPIVDDTQTVFFIQHWKKKPIYQKNDFKNHIESLEHKTQSTLCFKCS